MSRENWALIKRGKNFNVNIYRRGLTVLNIFLVLSGVMSGILFYLYLHQPERNYYATSGVVPPVMLQALSEPNRLGVALLEPDPPDDNTPRVIPE